MRIALCLYGQPRDFSKNWNRIKSSILENNNVDVFFHTWYDYQDTNLHKMTPGHENRFLEDNLVEKLIYLTNPKKYIIEPQIKFNDKFVPTTDENIRECWSYSLNFDRELFIKDRVKCSYSMWYSINQSILSKELYCQENKFEYDCVILSRFDISPNIKIDVSSLNLNNVTSGYKQLPRNEVNDWFLISNNINMNIISTIFYNIDYYRNKIISSNGIWTNEAFLRDHLHKFDLKVDYREDLKITF